MSAALAHRGPDGEGKRCAGPVALACRHLWVTPEEEGECQPLTGKSGALLVMDGRLDNRDELLPTLDLPRTVSDAVCALAAYEAWGERFAERLNGDFALALYDERRSRLLLARDAMGVRPIYWFRSERLFVFGSEIKALLAHPDVPLRPDDEGLADYVVVGSRPVERQALTCFAGISGVIPAHLLVVTPGGVTSTRYWDFDRTRTLRLASFGEYAEAFRERFGESVRRRARSLRPVAVSVSGGLDSSSILCHAETLRRSHALVAPRVIGISYIGEAGSEADEERYVAAMERQHGLTIERFAAERYLGVVRDGEEQVRAIEAPFLDYMWGVTQQVYRTAADAGARVLLTGHWGDQMLFSSAYLVDLFRRPAWRELGRHLREYRRWCGAGEARYLTRRFVRDVLRRSVPARLVPPLKWVRGRLFAPDRRWRWLGEDFRRRAFMDAHRPVAQERGFHSAQAQSLYMEVRSKYFVQCLAWNSNAGALERLAPAFPFLDRDLVAFLMMIPGEVHSQGGVPRALLREAMRGILPDAIRERTWKADFSAVANSSIARDFEPIARALTPSSAGARLGYFRADRIADETARLGRQLTVAEDCVDGWEVGDLLGLELWLRVFLQNGGAAAPAHPPRETSA
ncbi:MAG: asparagine synthetase B family protein [Gemmatimonadales bacterium]